MSRVKQCLPNFEVSELLAGNRRRSKIESFGTGLATRSAISGIV